MATTAAIRALPVAAQDASASAPRAYIDQSGPGWRALGEPDFDDVNGTPETWTWDGDLLRTTGEPAGVYCTAEGFANFELGIGWRMLEPGGDSGIWVWVPWQGIVDLPPGEVPQGIQAQILDHGYAEQYRERTGEDPTAFTTHGDVMPIGESTLIPFPPTSPNGSRSFPRRELSHGAGTWNHYYIRAINGELRLWVNGEEVSGGNGASPSSGHVCLESAGSPVEFRAIRIRELP